jgi:hypothetical protein
MMPGTPNPLYLAGQAQNMARNAEACDAKVFQKVALCSMCIMAAASAISAIQPLLRELNRKHHPNRGIER